MILAQVIDLDGDEVKKSESVIGGGEDTVSCLLHLYIKKNKQISLIFKIDIIAILKISFPPGPL